MSDERPPYQPIACDIYSEYELAIMHHEPLRLTWRAPDGSLHLTALLPLDLQTHNSEEFLIARALDGETVRLRLDWITHRESLDRDVNG